MSKAHKLTLAAMLLVGGYLAAWIFGGVPELMLSHEASTSAPASDSGWLAGFREWMSPDEVPSNAGTLVPESTAKPAAAPGASYAVASPQLPTWLSATSDSSDPAPIASQLPAAAPPRLLDASRTPPADAVTHSTLAAGSTPRARITEVRPVAAASKQPSASPWDRWPRWPANDGSVKQQAVPATFQELSAAEKPPLPTFHESEVVRKNSPPRDPGSAPADALRTHLVIDGDTLARLADRYLDNAQRADEIYRLNCDILVSPDLLPIGTELRIPARQRPVDSLAARLSGDAIAAVESCQSPALVPVPWMPKPIDDAPQAELLRPILAGRDD